MAVTSARVSLVVPAVVELQSGEAFAVPVSFHATERLKLSAGPGFEIEGGHAEFLARFSVSYAIPIWKFTLSPELVVDVLDQKQVFMYGFSFGGGF